jgi:hypothetical protein
MTLFRMSAVVVFSSGELEDQIARFRVNCVATARNLIDPGHVFVYIPEPLEKGIGNFDVAKVFACHLILLPYITLFRSIGGRELK